MWKKLSKILMAAIIFFSGVVLIPTIKAKAVGVDTVVKTLGGKAVVRAIAEETGMILAPKQLDNVVDVLERKTYDGDTRAIDFMNKANAIDMKVSSEPASKPGFKKYVLDPMLWLTGADLIFEAVDAFNDGYSGDTTVPVYGVDNTNVDTTIVGNNMWIVYNNGGQPYDWAYVFYPTLGSVTYDLSTTTINALNTNGAKVYKVEDGQWTYSNEETRVSFNNGPGITMINGYFNNTAYDYKPKQEDVVNVDSVSPVILEKFDNDTYNTDTIYELEIELPDNYTTYNYENDTTIWNMPDPELELEIGGGDDPPVIVDPDPDGDDGQGDSIDVLVRVDDEIPIHEKFFLEMADMGQKVEDMYNGVVHFFDVTIDGFTTLTDGMTGFVVFLDDFFDWLPAEYVALLGSGFTLGVVSFFLRR